MDNDHVLKLVRLALDEFDDRPLAASARRAARIARLNGAVQVSHRLHLELRPSLSAYDRASALKSLYPDLGYEQTQALHRIEVDRFLESRLPQRMAGLPPEERKVIYGSVDELHVQYALSEAMVEEAKSDGMWNLVAEGTQLMTDRREILDRIRAYVFDFLVRTEAQLELSDTVSQTLAGHRAAVDAILEATASDLRDQLQAALRTARAGDAEARSQVLTTCRRVIIAIADRLFPATTGRHVGTDGVARDVGASNYRNRILAALDTADTAGQAFASAITDLATRLDRLDDLTQKGVHAAVSVEEMEFGLAQTYLLAGELIRRTPRTGP